MKITNAKKFEKTVKTLANFCKPIDNKKRFCDNRIFAMDGKFYATNNRLMTIADVSDCVAGIEESGKEGFPFSFPTSVKAEKTLEFKDDKTLIVDGKEIEFEQNYVNVKKVIPDGEPSAVLSLDFNEHGYDLGKFGKGASVSIGKDEVVFDYDDETECKYFTSECYERTTDLLGDSDFGEFLSVRFPMAQMFTILKISKKIKIQQFGTKADNSRKIIAGDYEIVIVPLTW